MFRQNTISGVIKRWHEVCKMVDDGTRVLHRSQEQIMRQKLDKSGTSSATWFMKDEITSTMNVPYTPNGVLKSNIQNALKKVRGPDGGRTKIIETAGTVISRLMSPPTQSGCPYNKKCLVGDSNCQSPNVNYQVTCSDCPPPNSSPDDPPSLYIGTTGANIHHRSILHKNDKKSSLYKHNKDYHSDTITNYDRFNFVRTSNYNSVLTRVISEAFEIAHSSNRLMNSKGEYGAGKWISLESNKFTT